MSEWWTYRPSDFLMFAPETYWRLFELHNEAWWVPGLLAQVLVLALTLATWQGQHQAWRPGTALMAVLFAAVAAGFLWRLYLPINWGAQGLVWLYASMALGWLVLPWVAAARRSRAGTLLMFMAVLSWPLLAWAGGRPFSQAELIGLAPDPTAVAGLGLLLQTGARTRWCAALWWAMLALGLLACLVSAVTLATMEEPLAFAPLAAAAIALGAALAQGARPRDWPARRAA